MLILFGVIRKPIKGSNKGPYSQSFGFSSSHVWMWELACKGSWTLKNWCFWTVVLEKTLEGPWTAKRSNQSILKEINPEYHWKDWCWSSNTLATWCEEPTHWKRPWCWEGLKAKGEGTTGVASMDFGLPDGDSLRCNREKTVEWWQHQQISTCAVWPEALVEAGSGKLLSDAQQKDALSQCLQQFSLRGESLSEERGKKATNFGPCFSMLVWHSDSC